MIGSHDRQPPFAVEGSASRAIFERARAVFPDGTTRSTISRDPFPTYVKRGEGAYLVDVDGRPYLDLNGNFTTLIHGHSFGPVVAAVTRQLTSGTCFANPTEAEVNLASLLCSRVPRLERIRFMNTGTEAVMFAIKAARAYTGREGIAKIEGAYHGAYDWVEVAQSSGPDNWGPRDQPAATPYYNGVPRNVLESVVPLNFNDAEGAERLLSSRAPDLAAVIIDPMPSRAGLVAPDPEFIQAVQRTARAHGILVISDEVLNFRQAHEGASSRYGIEADIFTLGKIIGGGFPIGAVGGSADVMAVFSGDNGRAMLPQGGTFSANPISMVAGHAAMTALDEDAFRHLEVLGEALRNNLRREIERSQAPFCVTGAASLLLIHPKRRPPRNFREAYQHPKEVSVMKEMTRYFFSKGIILPSGAASSLSMPMRLCEIEHISDVFASFLVEKAEAVDRIA